MGSRGPRTREDIFYLVMQFLNEMNLGEFAEMIKDQTTTVLFNTKFLEVLVKEGAWEQAWGYVSLFGGSPEEQLSLNKIRYEISKQKYLEALLRFEKNNARHILYNEIMVLDLPETETQEAIVDIQGLARNLDATRHVAFFKFLPCLAGGREEHIETTRATLVNKLKNLIEEIPCLQENYRFRHLQGSGLWDLIDKRHVFGQLKIKKRRVVAIQEPENHPSTLSRDPSSSNPGRFDEPRNLGDGNRGLNEEGTSGSTSLNLITNSNELLSLRLLTDVFVDEQQILRLTYTNSGTAICALLSTGLNLVWKWPQTDLNPRGKATPTFPAESVRPHPMRYMLNDWPDAFPKTDISCFVLSSDDSFLLSASNGGEISMFNTTTFEKLQAKWSFTPPPPSATSLALFPQDNNIVAVGRDDGTIEVYISAAANENEVIKSLEGHTDRITGLAFSKTLNSLVSSGADAKIVVWSMDTWHGEVQRSLNIPSDRPIAAMSKTEIQFHCNGIRLLVVHETQLAILEGTTLECKSQWIVEQFAAPIHQATFSCNGDIIYSGFLDGTLCIFTVNADSLKLWCQINASAYNIPSFGSSEQYRCPLVVAAHPQNPHQIAIGLTKGQVYALETTLPEDDSV